MWVRSTGRLGEGKTFMTFPFLNQALQKLGVGTYSTARPLGGEHRFGQALIIGIIRMTTILSGHLPLSKQERRSNRSSLGHTTVYSVRSALERWHQVPDPCDPAPGVLLDVLPPIGRPSRSHPRTPAVSRRRDRYPPSEPGREESTCNWLEWPME